MPSQLQIERPKKIKFSMLNSTGPTILPIENPKGGAHKSTVTLNLGAALSRLGHSVLIMDFDEQISIQRHFTRGIDEKSWPPYNILDVLDGRIDLERAIQRSDFADFIGPAPEMLSKLMQALGAGKPYQSRLQRILAATNYDFILIDTPGRDGAEIRLAAAPATAIIMPVSPAVSTHEAASILNPIKEEYGVPLAAWPSGFGKSQGHQEDLADAYKIDCDGFLPPVPFYASMHIVFDNNWQQVSQKSSAGKAFELAALEISNGKS